MEDEPTKRVRLTVVTDSELQTFRSCHQLHDFKYRQRLRTRTSGRALAIGSIVHAGMAAGLTAGWDAVGRDLASLDLRLNRQIGMATAGVDARVDAWAGEIIANVQGPQALDFEALEREVHETAALVKWMLAHYFTAARVDLQTLELVEVERPFRVPMRDARDRQVGHLVYEGVRDAVLYDPTYNALVLYEHKTCGGDPRDLEKRVEMDTQTAGYLHALREEHRFGGGLVMVSGRPVPADASIGRVVYNVLRKQYPAPPKVNKDGSVSVANCVTTYDLYDDALRDQVSRGKPATDRQREFLQSLLDRGDRFFARVEWHRTKPEVERWRRDAFATARSIREADRDPDARDRNPGHCNMPWSMPCSYRSICLDPNAPELRSQFRVIDDVHEEVRSAQTEAA